MMSLKHAVIQKVYPLGSSNGVERVLISKPIRTEELFQVYGKWKNAFKSNLKIEEEFIGLGAPDQKAVMLKVDYIFEGLLGHYQIGLTTKIDKEDTSFIASFSLTSSKAPSFFKEQQELYSTLQNQLLDAAPDLVPLFERWSGGNIDCAQYMVTGYSMFYNTERAGIALCEEKPKNFNESFLDKTNLDSINRSLEIYENPSKEISNYKDSPRHLKAVVDSFNATPEGKIILVSPAYGVLKDII
jgi:hypothetical protein